MGRDTGIGDPGYRLSSFAELLSRFISLIFRCSVRRLMPSFLTAKAWHQSGVNHGSAYAKPAFALSDDESRSYGVTGLRGYSSMIHCV